MFPRQTRGTPIDPRVRFGPPALFDPDGFDEVHVSVTFSYDRQHGEALASAWERVLPTRLGGPAYGSASYETTFTPGRYLRHGFTITSRGCPGRCSYCAVWEREGPLREIEPVPPGWNVADNNLLACSEAHLDRVLAMLEKQRHFALFSGGLEAARITPAIVQKLLRLNIAKSGIWLAYDRADQREPVLEAVAAFRAAGLPLRKLRCYVLAAFGGDRPELADARCAELLRHGVLPFLMLYQPPIGGVERRHSREWRDLRRHWTRPALMLHGLEEE